MDAALVSTQLVGIVHFIFHRNTLMIGPTCYLQDLFTRPDIRGKGVGRALIEAVYDHARAAGATRVYWHTHETNSVAQRLYETVAARSGFIVYRKDL
jgi:GNAT superfamily N-acetyltransferase